MLEQLAGGHGGRRMKTLISFWVGLILIGIAALLTILLFKALAWAWSVPIP